MDPNPASVSQHVNNTIFLMLQVCCSMEDTVNARISARGTYLHVIFSRDGSANSKRVAYFIVQISASKRHCLYFK